MLRLIEQIAEFTKGLKKADRSIREARAELMHRNPEEEKQEILGQLNNCTQEMESKSTCYDNAYTGETEAYSTTVTLC